MNSKTPDRRGFLKGSAALAGLAVGAIPFANGKTLAAEPPEAGAKEKDLSYGERSRFETSVRTVTLGGVRDIIPGLAPGEMGQRLTPLQDSAGIITPASLHFMTGRGSHLADIDPREHRLMIHGMVDRPLVFTMEELKRLPSVSRIHFIECTGNSGMSHYKAMMKGLQVANSPALTKSTHVIQQVHGRVATSEWTGVLLSLLLKEAGVQKKASWLVAEGADASRHSKSFPLEKGMDDVLVAYAQNGEAVRPEQGYPLRLVVPGFQGVNNVKYVRSIKVVDQPYYLKVETANYTNLKPDGKASWFEYQVGPKSLITYPSDAHQLPGRGLYEISGLAWSGRGAISRVEVSTDGGRTWKDAQLQQPVFRKAFTRFRLAWNWDGAETLIQSRCTNEYGDIQPTIKEIAKQWGDSREPHISASDIENFWQTAAIMEFLTNPIQPWRVGQDGSVKDALYKV
jgi:sulfane dehydrogenase subunit SoxC